MLDNIDLSKLKNPPEQHEMNTAKIQCISDIKKQFTLRKYIKKILVIDKDGGLLELTRK